MQQAADGAEELQDGTRQLADGNDIIRENLELLADSTPDLPQRQRDPDRGPGPVHPGGSSWPTEHRRWMTERHS